jgi:hypothetical protein
LLLLKHRDELVIFNNLQFDVPITVMLFSLEEERKIRALAQIYSCLRKIGDDLIIDARADSISFRALNETQSALPVIQVHKYFFDQYQYSHNQVQLAYQLPVQWVIGALRCNSHLVAVNFSIHAETRTLTITLFDSVQIKHEWTLYLEQVAIMNAVFDMSETVATLHGRIDLFHGTEAAFKRNENILFSLRRRAREKWCVIMSQSECNDMSDRSCTFTIQSNDNCDITISDDHDELSLSFSRRDFCVGLAIAAVLAQRAAVHCIGPGSPVMMKASMPNSMQFQMAIATAIADDEDGQKGEPQEEPLLTIPDREDRRTATAQRTFATKRPAS